MKGKVPLQTTQILGSTTANYWRFYQLSWDPFSEDPTHPVYYAVSEWEHHLDLCQHLVQYSNVLLYLYGDKGTGKSIFLQQFLSQVDSEVINPISIAGHAKFTKEELVKCLAKSFDLPIPKEETIELQLEIQLTEIQYFPQTCVLIIDDAHLIPNETLNALLEMVEGQSENQMRLHIFLIGDVSLHEKIKHLEAGFQKPDLTHALFQKPLSFIETQEYILCRLQAAGFSSQKLPLSDSHLKHIFKMSGGVPVRVNRIARKEFLEALQKSRAFPNLFSNTHFKKPLWLGAFTLVCLLGGVLATQPLFSLRHSFHELKMGLKKMSIQVMGNLPSIDMSTPDKTPSLQKSAPLPISPTPSVGSLSEKKEPLEKHPAENAFPSKMIPLKFSNEPLKVKPISQDSLVSIKKPEEASPDLNFGRRVIPILQGIMNKIEKAASDISQKVSISESFSVKEGTVQSKLISFDSFLKEGAQPAALSSSSSLVPIKGPSNLIKQQPSSNNVEPKKKHIDPFKQMDLQDYTEDEEEALSLPKENFTIQLIMARHEESIRDFIRYEKLITIDNEYYVLRLKNHWFSLIQGDYKTHEEATKAIDSLPDSLKEMEPVIRSLKAVQKEIPQR